MKTPLIIAPICLISLFFLNPVFAERPPDIITFAYAKLDTPNCAKMNITEAGVKNLNFRVDLAPMMDDPYNTVPLLAGGNLFKVFSPDWLRFADMGLSDYYAYITETVNNAKIKIWINKKQYDFKYISIQSPVENKSGNSIDKNYVGVLMVSQGGVGCGIHFKQQ